MNTFSVFQKREWPDWVGYVFASLGLVVYFIQSILFAHTTVSNLDEGAYLLKGILFASGKYHPFDPGIWTNKAPFAFLIPGYVQLIFGAGLRTGRYLAVFFGVMAVIGTWVVARRMSGLWMAAISVWIFALSPAVIKFYSGGATQSTIACLLAWSLVFSLGERRPTWQLALSGFLAGVMMLVRQNMMPVFPLLVLYSFWEHRWKAIWVFLTGAAVIIWIHFLYWPDILQLWTWIPLIQFPAELAYTGGGIPSWVPDINLSSRLLSIFQAFRIHFAVLAGSIMCLLFWPRMINWKSRSDFRVGLFLGLLFFGLAYIHFMAAIGQDYCVYCFAPYIAFFNIVGVLLLLLVVKSWSSPHPFLKEILFVFLFVILCAGMGFSAFEDIGGLLLNLPAPRVRNLMILPGIVTWREIFSNGFHLDTNLSKKYVSAIFGLIIGGLISLLIYEIWRRIHGNLNNIFFGPFFASTTLIIGIILSPILHGSLGYHDCNIDVIRVNEEIGDYLQSVIPRGSLIYWNGGLSVAPLLYLPDVKIFPAQINDGYAFIGGGDTTELYKFGHWNEEMDAKWRATADFFIIEEKRYPGWEKFFIPDQFDEYKRTEFGTSCDAGTRLRIFKRK